MRHHILSRLNLYTAPFVFSQEIYLLAWHGLKRLTCFVHPLLRDLATSCCALPALEIVGVPSLEKVMVVVDSAPAVLRVCVMLGKLVA